MVAGLFLQHFHVELSMFASPGVVRWLDLSVLLHPQMTPWEFDRLQQQMTICTNTTET